MTLKQLKPENCRLVRNILVSNALRTVRELDEKCAVATDCSRAVNRKKRTNAITHVAVLRITCQLLCELIMLRYFRN